MMKQVTDKELEDSVVRMCAPTLLGVKPANMFTFSGHFSDDEVQAPSANAFEDARVWCRAAGCEEPFNQACADGCAGSWSQPHAADDEHDCTDQRCSCTITGRRREELGLLVHRLDRELGPHGVRVRVIAWRAFGACVSSGFARFASARCAYNSGVGEPRISRSQQRITCWGARNFPRRAARASCAKVCCGKAPPRDWLLLGLSLRGC